MYQCEDCENLTFERRSVCERHIFEKHSGFGYKCSECQKIFNRPENHQGRCLGAEMRLTKKATGTYTEDEQAEHQEFMKNLSAKVKTVLRPPKTPSGRKETHTKNRKRSHSDHRENRRNESQRLEKRGKNKDDSGDYEDRRRVLHNLYPNNGPTYQQRNPQRYERKVITETVSRRTWKDDEDRNSKDDTEDKENREKEREVVEVPKEPATVTIPQNIPQLPSDWDALSLYTDGQIDEEEVEAAVKSLSEELAREQTETTQIPNSCEVIPSSAHSTVSSVPEYQPSDRRELKLNKMVEIQNKRIVLNIGGTKFETSAPTLMTDPNSILAAIVGPNTLFKPYNLDNVYTYFIDRDPRHFHTILNYLRNGLELCLDRLPSDARHLRELEDECKFYELKHLELLCAKKILEIKEAALKKYL